MWITRNDLTGTLTLQPKPDADALLSFLRELEAMPVGEEFIPARDDGEGPDPLADWSA